MLKINRILTLLEQFAGLVHDQYEGTSHTVVDDIKEAYELVAEFTESKSLPERDPTHGADKNGRPAYPEDAKISVLVLVNAPSNCDYPVTARYSYGLGLWMGVSSLFHLKPEKITEWWSLPEAGSGIKPPADDQDECECENLGSQCHSCEGDEDDNNYA